jgi:hypothetical protein
MNIKGIIIIIIIILVIIGILSYFGVIDLGALSSLNDPIPAPGPGLPDVV